MVAVAVCPTSEPLNFLRVAEPKLDKFDRETVARAELARDVPRRVDVSRPRHAVVHFRDECDVDTGLSHQGGRLGGIFAAFQVPGREPERWLGGPIAGARRGQDLEALQGSDIGRDPVVMVARGWTV